MLLYQNLLDTFINLFYGSAENLENLKTTIPLTTNNRFQDLVNAIQLNFASVATIGTIILFCFLVVMLPVAFYKMFQINDKPKRRGKKW